MIDRRAFLATLAGGLLAAPLAAAAQQAAQLPRIGNAGMAAEGAAKLDAYLSTVAHRKVTRGGSGR